jgi:hypothetical protein
MNSAPMLPNYLGLPFRILVSPFVNFDPENRVTDIMMFNSRNLGIFPAVFSALAPGHDLEQALGSELADSNSRVTAAQCRRPEKASSLYRVQNL